MPGMDGLELIKSLKDLNQDIEILVLTGFGTIDNAIEALQAGGAFDFLRTPMESIDAFFNTICQALEKRRLRIQNRTLLEELRKHRDDLEELVEERTAELVRSNEHLQQEITERKQAEEQLKAALHAKGLLLKEVPHRTRNNMTVMSALLDFQSEHIEDAQARHAFKSLRDRIDAMTLVHHKLHQEDLTTVNFKDYIDDLVQTLLVSHQAHPDRISVISDLEPVLLTIDSAVPFGWLLHELLSNALKYAFPDGRAGEIRISLHTTDAGQRELRVRDNGVGLPEEFDIERPNSLGCRLITILAEQLRGTVDVQRQEPGTEMIIQFKEYCHKKRI